MNKSRLKSYAPQNPQGLEVAYAQSVQLQRVRCVDDGATHQLAVRRSGRRSLARLGPDRAVGTTRERRGPSRLPGVEAGSRLAVVFKERWPKPGAASCHPH